MGTARPPIAIFHANAATNRFPRIFPLKRVFLFEQPETGRNEISKFPSTKTLVLRRKTIRNVYLVSFDSTKDDRSQIHSHRQLGFLSDSVNKFYNNRSHFHEGIKRPRWPGFDSVMDRLEQRSLQTWIDYESMRVILTRSRSGKRLELLLMMGITVPGVGRRLCPLRAIVQIQTSHQLRYLPVLLLFFGQRVSILRAKT